MQKKVLLAIWRASVWCHSNAPTCLGVLKSPRPVMIRQELLTKASASTSSSTIRWYFDFDPPIPTVVLQRKLCRFLTRVIRCICLVLCNKYFFKRQSYIKLQMIRRPNILTIYDSYYVMKTLHLNTPPVFTIWRKI